MISNELLEKFLPKPSCLSIIETNGLSSSDMSESWLPPNIVEPSLPGGKVTEMLECALEPCKSCGSIHPLEGVRSKSKE